MTCTQPKHCINKCPIFHFGVLNTNYAEITIFTYTADISEILSRASTRLSAFSCSIGHLTFLTQRPTESAQTAS